MYLADALSRAYPTQSVPVSSPQSEFCHSVEVVDLTKHLPISSRCLKQIQKATNKNSTLRGVGRGVPGVQEPPCKV